MRQRLKGRAKRANVRVRMERGRRETENDEVRRSPQLRGEILNLGKRVVRPAEGIVARILQGRIGSGFSQRSFLTRFRPASDTYLTDVPVGRFGTEKSRLCQGRRPPAVFRSDAQKLSGDRHGGG